MTDENRKIGRAPWRRVSGHIALEAFKPFIMADSSDEAKKAAGENLARRFAYLEA